MPEAMQHLFSLTGRCVAWMACIISLALSSADLLGVFWKSGLSSIMFPNMTGMVGFCLFGFFRRFSPSRACSYI